MTAKSTDWGGDYPIQVDSVQNTITATVAQITAREEAEIGQHRHGKTSTDENKQCDRGRTTADPLISAEVAMLYTVCFVVRVFVLVCISSNFQCYHARY